MSSFIEVKARVSNPPRRPDTGGKAEFVLQSLDFTQAWGAQPGSGVCTYVRETLADETIRNQGVLVGSYMEIVTPAHVFYGICKSDAAVEATGGKVRTLEFDDLRIFLQWDFVFCEFNRVESRIVTLPDGSTRRVRRFRHILPDRGTRLTRRLNMPRFTDTPYTAAQILDYLFTATSVATAWQPIYHPDQDLFPVYDLDFMNGTRLDAALVQISNAQGLTFTMSNAWQLEWTRKGYLKPGEVFPTFNATPTNPGQYIFPVTQAGDPASDDNRDGWALSGNPTRVLVLGDRNLYQDMNVGLVPDWSRAWEQFYDENLLTDFIFYNFAYDGIHTYSEFASQNPASELNEAGQHEPDPAKWEHIIGGQMAAIRAKSITVREFAAVMGTGFLDFKKFAGRSRLDMPAYLYIQHILFRAFRLPGTISIDGGVARDVLGLRLEDRMLVAVNYDPVTGVMSPDYNQPVDGNGFALVRGYEVGKEAFTNIHPTRFDPGSWATVQKLWGPAPFHIDDSGDGQRFILFDNAVINSSDLETLIDGVPVVYADPVFNIPQVTASLTFAAETFYLAFGSGSRDAVANESGLFAEVVYDRNLPVGPNNPRELLYSDAKSASTRALEIATTQLILQWTYRHGGFKRYLLPGDTRTLLNGMYDRVHVHADAGGFFEEVDFTTQRASNAMEPVRAFERLTVGDTLFPNQKELRQTQRATELFVAALRQNPGVLKTLSTFVHQPFTKHDATKTWLTIANGSGTLRAGTPLCSKPLKRVQVAATETTAAYEKLVNTSAVMPAASTSEHTIFRGAVQKENQRANSRSIPVLLHGDLPVRVMGPVKANGELVLSPGNEYLEAASVATTTPAAQFDAFAQYADDGGASNADLLAWIEAAPLTFELTQANYDLLDELGISDEIVTALETHQGTGAVVSTKPTVGRAQQEIAGKEVKLIYMRTGGGGGAAAPAGTGDAVWA